ncbi:MFS transporter [Levilactobacillus tujiorum]|uniref:MFS transporter n=1 Tax=Levilactobacillus tujiorum TaxID=2912243 RepID=A0ABX1L963_9LACO|nr:MFS transporter [Levilactobacillus tujiorum]MCH5465788.1 MFS transporter [Levilactobacillus tujiorum]NLR13007.1 MFS transporter [Lactobacillus sp. HBUAS51387]NLR30818.1 MFS transporter [Levilactobacillus tujiorum]
MKDSMKNGWLVLGLFLIVFVIGADSFIISPLLPVLAQSYHASITMVALSVTIYAICYAIGSPLLGPLGDRFPKRRLLLVGVVIFFVGGVACVWAPTVGWFNIGRAVAGIGAATTLPNVWALIGQMFHGKQLNLIMGITMAALSLSIALGVPMGTELAQLVNWRLAFVVSVGLTLLAGGILYRVIPRRALVMNKVDYWQSYDQIGRSLKAKLALLITLTWMLGFYVVYTFLGTFITRQFHLNTGQTGLVFVAYGLSNFVASFFGGVVMTKFGKLATVQLSGVLSAVAMAGLLAGQQSLLAIIGSLIVLAIVQGLGVTALNTIIVNLLPLQRATMMASNSAILYLGLTVSSSVGGWAYPRVGFFGITLAAMGVLLIAVGLARRLRKWL